MSRDTLKRYDAIKELITKHHISDQLKLVELLKDHHNIDANQAVVSRDLRKLGIVKKMVNGSLCYEIPDLDVKTEILRLALVDISYNESTIVITTHPALADFVGDCVDQYDDLEVLGCLAGENVVFVAPKSIKQIKQVYERICEKFHFKKKKDN